MLTLLNITGLFYEMILVVLMCEVLAISEVNNVGLGV